MFSRRLFCVETGIVQQNKNSHMRQKTLCQLFSTYPPLKHDQLRTANAIHKTHSLKKQTEELKTQVPGK